MNSGKVSTTFNNIDYISGKVSPMNRNNIDYIYYTIVDAREYMKKDDKAIAWKVLFEKLDKKVSEAGFSISSGKTITEDPYKDNKQAKYINIEPDTTEQLPHGQLLSLLKIEF